MHSAPGPSAAPLVANTPMLEGADRLRRSLVPSLLDVRRINESLSNPTIELFETARIYLAATGGLATRAAHAGCGKRPWIIAPERNRRSVAGLRCTFINRWK